jgi:CheY-like chemotaxis protein
MATAKPVLLTVDDDPEVGRAVERDLRRHYGDRYRVLQAASGPAALALLAASPSAATRWRCCSSTSACPR